MSQKKFSSLGVSQDTVTVLDKKGYEFATPIQEELIPHFFNNSKDLLTISFSFKYFCILIYNYWSSIW